MLSSVPQWALVGLVCLFLASCGKTTGTSDQSLKASLPQQVSEGASGIPAQDLLSGECATFLWEEKQGRRLVFFHRSGSENAKIFIDGIIFTAQRTTAEEEIVRGFFSLQKFAHSDKIIQLRLQSRASKNIVEGIRIPNGVMTVKEENGSQQIISVSGLYGCKM